MSDSEDGGQASDALDPKEQVKARHRKEKRDLQAKITALKRAAQSDKKAKKELPEKIQQLEAELEARHAKELQQCETTEATPTAVPSGAENENDPAADSKSGKKSKAEKRREKQAEDVRRHLEAVKLDALDASQSSGTIERTAIDKVLRERGLRVAEIAPDGDCLYNSVAHELRRLNGGALRPAADVRTLAADYIRQNQDDFLPFLSDAEQPMSCAEFSTYCDRVQRLASDGGEWGGEPELRALSHSLQHPIDVIQPDCRVLRFGDQFDRPPLILTYHRFAYRLGEHYNATEPLAAA